MESLIILLKRKGYPPSFYWIKPQVCFIKVDVCCLFSVSTLGISEWRFNCFSILSGEVFKTHWILMLLKLFHVFVSSFPFIFFLFQFFFSVQLFSLLFFSFSFAFIELASIMAPSCYCRSCDSNSILLMLVNSPIAEVSGVSGDV
jgi:hypothetical protein